MNSMTGHPPGPPGISVRNLTKTFHRLTLPVVLGAKPRDKGFTAVADVSFEVPRGERFGLVGPNGAGKTTLIKCVCGLLNPTAGSVTIEGLDTVRHAERIKNTVGLVTSNERSFYWRLTGQQNLEFFASIYKLDRDESRAWIGRLMEFLGITQYRDRRFDSFSTGTKQRFAIARGMLSRPKFLLLDEPTKGVDPVNAADIVDLLANKLDDIWRPTIIITSHDLREIELLCPRVGIMHRSRLIATGTVDELARQSDLKSTESIRFSGAGRFEPSRLPPEIRALSPDVAHGAEDLVTLTFVSDEGSGSLGRVLRSLLDQGVTIQSVERRRQSLDDVFFNIVSR